MNDGRYGEWLAPLWSEPSRREREFLDAGEPLTAPTEFGEVRGRLWRSQGDSRGTVLLVHGWAGRGATWLVLAPLLNAAGFDALAFDAPGHGETRGPKGPARSHFFAFAATLLAAQKTVPGEPFRAVVGHSFGACLFPYLLRRGLWAERAVLIAPTARVGSFLTRWAESQGLTPDETETVRERWVAEFGAEVLASTDPETEARRMTIPALILHDEGDAECPLDDGRALAKAWPGARLEVTTGVGHRRILLSRDAMARVVAFVESDR